MSEWNKNELGNYFFNQKAPVEVKFEPPQMMFNPVTKALETMDHYVFKCPSCSRKFNQFVKWWRTVPKTNVDQTAE